MKMSNIYTDQLSIKCIYISLQERIEDLDGTNSKLKKTLKKAKDDKNAINMELEETRQDLHKKENQV